MLAASTATVSATTTATATDATRASASTATSAARKLLRLVLPMQLLLLMPLLQLQVLEVVTSAAASDSIAAAGAQDRCVYILYRADVKAQHGPTGKLRTTVQSVLSTKHSLNQQFGWSRVGFQL